MLPLEIVDRTFRIEFGGSTGTAFTLDVDGRQYLLTAKHVVESMVGVDNIRIAYGGKWINLIVSLVGHSDVDISVLAVGQQLTDERMLLDYSFGNFIIGQEAYFVGFPLGMTSVSFESSFPSPLLKKCVFSGREPGDEGLKHPFYLDGFNNRGFSGAPVFYKDFNSHKYVVGFVISSYVAEPEFLKDSETELNFHVMVNSGIIQAYSIKNAIDIILANPIGFVLPTD